MQQPIILRSLVVGDKQIGKSSFIRKLNDKEFDENTFRIYEDHSLKLSQIDNTQVKAFIWDYPKEGGCSNPKNYYRNLNGVIFMYDITNRSSFESLSNWIDQCNKYSPNTHDQTRILIANKCDLDISRQVSLNEGLEFSKQYGLLFFEVSNKTGDNVEKSIEVLRELMLNKK